MNLLIYLGENYSGVGDQNFYSKHDGSDQLKVLDLTDTYTENTVQEQLTPVHVHAYR